MLPGGFWFDFLLFYLVICGCLWFVLFGCFALLSVVWIICLDCLFDFALLVFVGVYCIDFGFWALRWVLWILV